jgi:hypothetical protein
MCAEPLQAAGIDDGCGRVWASVYYDIWKVENRRHTIMQAASQQNCTYENAFSFSLSYLQVGTYQFASIEYKGHTIIIHRQRKGIHHLKSKHI